MLEEVIGVITTIAFLVVSVLALKIVMDAVYNLLPPKGQQFFDDNF